jgi:FdhD protein
VIRARKPRTGERRPPESGKEKPPEPAETRSRATLGRVALIPPHAVGPVDLVRLPGGEEERDEVAVEEPLEIRVNGEPVAVTMRTPGHDEELAAGFLLSEGIRPLRVSLPHDLSANTVDVEASDFDPGRLKRHFYTSSSCGVCGKGALEAVAVEAPRVESLLRVPGSLVETLPERLRAAQPAFAATGGLHATGLFDATGVVLCVREDVGRHNAMDKVIGWAHGAGELPLAGDILCVSGRLSFELVQKAAVAGCPALVAVGAPSTLAVELARDRGITLCGFVRGGRVNVYSEPWRITA